MSDDQVQLETRTDIPKSPERPFHSTEASITLNDEGDSIVKQRDWNRRLERRNSEIVTSSLVEYSMHRSEAVLIRALSVVVTTPAFADSSLSHSDLS